MLSTLNHRQMEKKRKERVWTKEKMMKRNRFCIIGVFGSSQTHSCVKHEKQVRVDKKGVIVEGWKARRKEWKKKEVKKGKGKKWFWEKSFLFLFDCVFASSLFPHAPTTSPRHNTRSHSPITHTT